MIVHRYTLTIPALIPGDQTISSEYHWWFYATPQFGGLPEAARTPLCEFPEYDDKLPSVWLSEAMQGKPTPRKWARALHAYVAMAEWGLIVPPVTSSWGCSSPLVHAPLHELVHRVAGTESGVSDARVLYWVFCRNRVWCHQWLHFSF